MKNRWRSARRSYSDAWCTKWWRWGDSTPKDPEFVGNRPLLKKLWNRDQAQVCTHLLSLDGTPVTALSRANLVHASVFDRCSISGRFVCFCYYCIGWFIVHFATMYIFCSNMPFPSFTSLNRSVQYSSLNVNHLWTSCLAGFY